MTCIMFQQAVLTNHILLESMIQFARNAVLSRLGNIRQFQLNESKSIQTLQVIEPNKTVVISLHSATQCMKFKEAFQYRGKLHKT